MTAAVRVQMGTHIADWRPRDRSGNDQGLVERVELFHQDQELKAGKLESKIKALALHGAQVLVCTSQI
jgi:hypothetical protein